MLTRQQKNARKQRRREEGPPQKFIHCEASGQPTGHRDAPFKCPKCERSWVVSFVTIPQHSRKEWRP